MIFDTKKKSAPKCHISTTITAPVLRMEKVGCDEYEKTYAVALVEGKHLAVKIVDGKVASVNV